MSNKNKIINQAQKFIQKGQWDKAIKELQKLVAEDPNDVRTLLKLGDVYAKKGERDQATKVYKQVAESYSEQGFFLKSVAVYKQILKHDPSHLEVTLKLAELYEHLGLTSEAMAQYQVASQIHDETGKQKEALDVLRRMVEIDADNVASRIKLAEGYSRENQVPEAIQEFFRACEILKRQNRTDDYIKVAERLVYHDPNRIDVIKDLAQLYLKKGDTKRGLAKLQLCFKAQPKDIETLTLLADAFRDLGQTQKTVFVYRELARIHQEQGRDNETRATLQKIIELDPSDQEARSALGFGLTSGQMAQAMPNPFGQSFSQQMAAPLGSGPKPPPLTPPPPQIGASASGMFTNTGTMSPPPARESRNTPRINSTTLHDPYPGRTIPPPQMPPPLAPPADFAQGDWQGASDEAMSFDHGMKPPLEDEPAPYAQSPPPLVPSKVDAVAIQKILTETDVYIKYGLREKALEHLRRIFELDPDNALAYTKMRDVYLGVGDTARAAESIANLIHIHSRRGDVDALKGARAELEALAPGHPLIAGAHPGKMWPEKEDVDSIDITENSDTYNVDEFGAHAASIVPDPTLDAPDPIASQPDHLDAWLQEDPSDAVSASDPISDAFEMREDSSDGPPPAKQPSGDIENVFDSSFRGQFNFAEQSSVVVGEQDIVSASTLDPVEEAAEQVPEPDRFRAFAEDSFDREETDAQHNPQRARFRASQGSRPAHDVSDLEIEAAAAIQSDMADDELPEASESQVVALDDVAELDEAEAETTPKPAHLTSDLIDHAPSFAANTGRAEAMEEPPEEELPEPTTDARGDQHTEDELDEAEFLFGEGLVVEAIEIVEGVLSRLPGHARAISLRAMLSSVPADADTTADQGIALHGTRNGATQDVPEAGGHEDFGAVSDDDMASAFGQMESDEGGAGGESPEDHYDQGIAYKEVGRLDDAVAHFRKAVRSSTRGIDSLEMLGHCLLAKGDAEGAITNFWQALERGAEGPAATNLKYEIASAYQSAGDEQQAVYWFRLCYADDPEHRDVRGRIEAFGVDPDGDPEGDPPQPPPSNGSYPPQQEAQASSAPSKRNKISYL